jgi:hypothetical protein
LIIGMPIAGGLPTNSPRRCGVSPNPEADSMKFLNSRKFLVLALIVVFSSFALGAWAKKGQSQESVIHDLETFAK